MKRHSPPVVAISQISRLGISAAIRPKMVVPSGREGSPPVAVPPGAPGTPSDDIGPTTPPRECTGVGVKVGVVAADGDVGGDGEAETEGDGVAVGVAAGVATGVAVGAGGRGVGGGVAGTGVAVGLTTVTVEGLTLASVAVSTPDLDPATARNE